MKKVLIITYYWPPSGGVGVQRWLKFSKYLKDYNWEPIIFTPENPDFDVKDHSGLEDIPSDIEILKLPIWEPYHLFKKLRSGDKNLKQGLVLEKSRMSLFDKISLWIRGNLIIPDPRRFWIKPAYKCLERIIENNEIDIVVTTGPPHSMHLIGLHLKAKHNVTWIADFRDPWSKWDMLDRLKVSRLAKLIHRILEKRVLKNADLTLATSKRQAEDFRALGADTVAFITNGFDELISVENTQSTSEKFVISHIGLLSEIRNPSLLWEVLDELCNENQGFKNHLSIRLGGIISEAVLNDVNRYDKLRGNLMVLDYIPHQEIYEEYSKAEVLLLINNNSDNSRSILPAKLFEYLNVGKSILLIGQHDSDAADIVNEFDGNYVVDFEDKTVLKSAIESLYDSFLRGNMKSKTEGIEKYSRRNLTKELADLLDGLMKTKNEITIQ